MVKPAENPHARMIACVLFAGAAVTDAIDGLLARLLRQKTELGAFLDPLADKMLILAGMIGIFLTLQPVYQPPLWFLVIVLFRELVFVIGFLTFLVFSKRMRIRPNLLGKATTLSQMLVILFCVLNWPGAQAVVSACALLTIASGFVYTGREWKNLTGEES